LRDKLLVGIDRVYYVWVILSLAIPTAIGGLATFSWYGALLGLLWGGLARICIGHHITWSVNSVCHMFGRREFRTTDRSTNNLIVGVLAWGEGWHNNHHAFPTSARHGLAWWQLDPSWLLIRLMEKLGLVWDVRLPSPAAMDAKRLIR
jgi:stearoyl-CoA desaturase (delta-9 desaturase)